MKKLFKYRTERRKAEAADRAAAKQEQERRNRSGAYVDRALRGTSEVDWDPRPTDWSTTA